MCFLGYERVRVRSLPSVQIGVKHEGVALFMGVTVGSNSINKARKLSKGV